MIDLHCHLLPYVDDGANDLQMAKDLLKEQAEQGVKVLCFTPHLRKGMFETSDAEILRQYRRLQPLAKAAGINAFLSREYHWDNGLRARLREGNVIPMGRRNWLLVEFSSLHSFEQIREGVQTVRAAGYRPLIAHCERYPAVTVKTAEQLIELGAWLQVNAGSILGEEGRSQKRLSRKLLSREMVAVVASDAHDLENRKPNLLEVRRFLLKHSGKDLARKLLVTNPATILRGTR